MKITLIFLIAGLFPISQAGLAATTKTVEEPSSVSQANPNSKSGKRIPPSNSVPTASITISCGNGKKFSLTTGNGKGKCTTLPLQYVDSDGKTVTDIAGGTCNDGNGNSSNFDCGQGCSSTSGSGNCSPVQ